MDEQASKIRLLCVDDSVPLIAAWVRLIQNQPDMEMVGTLSSADALEATVRTTRPSVVMMDVSMSGRDPLDALAELRVSCPEVRVIIYSGRSEPELIAHALKSGARAFLDKGRPPMRILEAIRQVAHDQPVRG